MISPLLANIYLHEVLDVWFENVVKPRMRGRARLIRYADDFVICFEREDDARRVAEVLPKRFAEYGLTLHPDKTRLFGYRAPDRGDKGDPPSFDFLGFTHYWARSRACRRVTKRKTMAKSDNYFGITCNAGALAQLFRSVRRAWRYWLSRRSQRGAIPWDDFARTAERFPLPRPRIVHHGSNTVRSKSMVRRAGCGKPARPDLWGAERVTARSTRYTKDVGPMKVG